MLGEHGAAEGDGRLAAGCVPVRGKDHHAALGQGCMLPVGDPEHGPAFQARRLADRERAFRSLRHHERSRANLAPGREARRESADLAEGRFRRLDLRLAARGRQQDALAAHGPAIAVQAPHQEGAAPPVADRQVRDRREPSEAALRKIGDAAPGHVPGGRRSGDGPDAVKKRCDRCCMPVLPLAVILGRVRFRSLRLRDSAPGAGARAHADQPRRFLQDPRKVVLRRRQVAAGDRDEIEQVAAGVGGEVEPDAAALAPHLHRDRARVLVPPFVRGRAGRLPEGGAEQVFRVPAERGFHRAG